MSAIKRFAEQVSEEMGFEGEINDLVLAEAQRRCDAAEKERRETIKLSDHDWFNDIGKLMESGRLSQEAGRLLRDIVSNHLTHSIMPAANQASIQEAQDFLSGGFEIKAQLFDITVYVPCGPDADKRRTFFVVIPRYPGGELRRLDEVDASILWVNPGTKQTAVRCRYCGWKMLLIGERGDGWTCGRCGRMSLINDVPELRDGSAKRTDVTSRES